MDKRLLYLAGGFVLGFIISFFYVNSTYQQSQSNAANNTTGHAEKPHDHDQPPANSEANKTATNGGSKSGPLEALGGSKSDDKKTPEGGDKSAKPDANIPKASAAYKNIQVLKDVPASQVMTVMQSFTEGLGVTCTHCHTSIDDAASDDKPAKQIARKMLIMTRDINKSYPTDGHVTCYTCHRGALKPAS